MRLASYPYSLAEILLALVVAVIGVVGVTGLLPADRPADRTTIAQTRPTDVGDPITRAIATKLKVNWEISTALPTAKPGDDESAVNFSANDAGNTLHKIEGVTLGYDDVDGDGRFDFDVDGGDADATGFFRIERHGSADGEDRTTVVRVWRSAVTYRYYDPETGAWIAKSVPATSGIKLHVELSYPAELPYASRQKTHRTLNVFRPLEQPAIGYVFAGNLTTKDINQPPRVALSGSITLAPNTPGPASGPAFTLTLADGTEITGDDLRSGYDGYTGEAISVLVRPSGGGSQNGLQLNAKPVALTNARCYHAAGQLSVRLYRDTADTPASSGDAPGRWRIDITATNAVLSEAF